MSYELDECSIYQFYQTPKGIDNLAMSNEFRSETMGT